MLVVLGMATTNNAAVGKGIGKVAVRDEEYPHCSKAERNNECIATCRYLTIVAVNGYL